MKFIAIASLLVAGFSFLSGCAPVDLLNATIPGNGYSVIKDVAYRDGARGKLDMYLPDQGAPGHPVVVFYYGGSWKTGTKDDYLFVGQAFASRGIIAVIADYRLYPEVYFPAFMEDSAAAFVWVHDHIGDYGGDPRNLFAAGHSAGAYNAVMLALDRDYLNDAGGNAQWIRGVIGIAGPYDFLPLTDPALIEIFSRRPIALTQPIHFARRRAPPMLLMTGDQDEEVLPRNSYNLAEKLDALGNSVAVKTYPGVAHIGIALAFANGFRGKAPVLDDSAAFIKSIALQSPEDEHAP